MRPRWSIDVKIAIQKAGELFTATAELYRELTLSALRLVPGRREG